VLHIFWREIKLACSPVEENVGMPENYRFMMDYMITNKKSLKSLYYLIDFTKYFSSVTTNSGAYS
jgi:hypothetical protein